MSTDIIIEAVQLVIMVASFALGRYVLPNIKKDDIAKAADTLDIIFNYAVNFICWAKQFKKEESGEGKMNCVVEQLKLVAHKYNLDVSDEEIQAIAQKAYNEMKDGLEEAESTKSISETNK